MISMDFGWNSIPFWPKKLHSSSKIGQVMIFPLRLYAGEWQSINLASQKYFLTEFFFEFSYFISSWNSCAVLFSIDYNYKNYNYKNCLWQQTKYFLIKKYFSQTLPFLKLLGYLKDKGYSVTNNNAWTLLYYFIFQIKLVATF